jgi:hypothetical protein
VRLSTYAPSSSFSFVSSRALPSSPIPLSLSLSPCSQERQRALELLAPRIVDRQNAFTVLSVLAFSQEKEYAGRLLA